ncbi:MAG: AAA family ATPase [Candidatus Pacearchaeota archaeon]|nr:AAA family ATPase [Candidatus Pacearchaeota archaeon]
MKYKKIVIFGLTASGKTTLAKNISKILNIKVYHSDDFAYKKKWTIKSSEKEFMHKLGNVTRKKEWIIEGVHSEWLSNAVKKTDLVIFLNPHKFVMTKRALIRSKGKKDSLKQKLKLLYWIYRWGPSWYRKYKHHSKNFLEVRNSKDKEILLEKLKLAIKYNH